MYYTAKFRKNPPPQEPGTRYFGLDDDDSVPERGGSRPDRLLSVSGPQERVQRHTVEQNIDTFAAVPMLDAPVPLVGQLVEVLKIVDMMVPDVEQVIKVPKIALEDGIPRRGELREPRVVELRRGVARLVEARHRTAMEVLRWCSDLVRRGVALTRLHGTLDARLQEEGHRQPRAENKCWARLRRCAGLWLCTSLCSSATSSCSPRSSTGWCLRSSSFPECGTFCCEQRRVRTVPNCAEDRRFVRCSSWWKLTCPFACNDRWFRQCRNLLGAAGAVHRQGVEPL